MRKLVFDIETKNIFQDVGSNNPEDLDISIVGIYDYETGKYQSFAQEEFDQMWPYFKKAELLVTFNGEYFDIPLLNKYYRNAGHGDLRDIKSLDIFKEIKQTSGRWLKLDKIAMGTFGINKSGYGLEAVKWWREGKVDEIRKYCLDDVKITKDVCLRSAISSSSKNVSTRSGSSGTGAAPFSLSPMGWARCSSCATVPSCWTAAGCCLTAPRRRRLHFMRNMRSAIDTTGRRRNRRKARRSRPAGATAGRPAPGRRPRCGPASSRCCR